MRGLGMVLLAAFAVASVCGARAGEEIAVIVKTPNLSFWQNVSVGAEDAARELKADGAVVAVTFDGPAAETEIEKQIAMVDAAVDRGVKAVVLAPADPDALAPSLRRAVAAGIPAVIIDSAVNADDLELPFLATNNRAAGELCARELIERLGGGNAKGAVAVMSYVAGVGSEIGRVGGFRDYIEKNSKLTIVATRYSNADMATAMRQTAEVLDAYPDLVGILGANEPTAVGMGRAIKSKGRSGKIVAIGFDGDQSLQSFVRDGTLQGIAVQNPYNMGYLGVKAAFDAAEDGTPDKKTIDTGIVFVTRHNIDSIEAMQVLY